MREAFFDTGSVTINYAEGPANGAPLILIHGGSARWQGFEAVLPALTERWHVYAVDLRGHGKSGWAKHYRLQDYVADTAALLLARVREPAFVFGHSLGGMVALMLAAQHPGIIGPRNWTRSEGGSPTACGGMD
jgi:pimeloyl-ACP methyl ester carboxylesterase